MTTKTLRVLHIDDQMSWGGGQQQVIYLCGGLPARGIHSTLCCRPGSEIHKKAETLGIPTVELPLRGELDVSSITSIAKMIRKDEYDICHAHTSHAHTMACMASATAKNCKVVVSRRVISPRRKNPLSKAKYRFGVDLYIAISEAVKSVLVSDGVDGERIKVIHSGISLSRIDSVQPMDLSHEIGVPPDSLVIGIIGSLVDAKGHIFLIRAMPLILRSIPNAFLVIVGEGDERKALEAEADKFSEHLLFTGFREDAPRLLRAFDICAIPSIREGLNTSLLDAMAANKPVVASSVGGIPEVIENGRNGILVPTEDVEALADGIVKLAGDREFAKKLGQNARKTVLNSFTDDIMVERTAMAYMELMGA